MDSKKRAWLLIAVMAALCGGSVWGVIWYRSRPLSTAALLRRMPAADALVVYIDFSELRRAGILRLLSSTAGQDPDYQKFVRKTDFDYTQDLDAALLSFAPAGRYMFLRGRFDWKNLRDYVRESGGDCYNALCNMIGSSPERRISFYPVQSRLMAMAVSREESAVLRLQGAGSGPLPESPNAPIWISIPAATLRSGDALPEGTRMFARTMERADNVTLGFSPEGERLAARLEVRCRNEQDAADISAQLTRATSLLKDMIEREHHQPNPADMSGVLTSGTFRSEGRLVRGYWPIERVFLENMLSGAG